MISLNLAFPESEHPSNILRNRIYLHDAEYGGILYAFRHDQGERINLANKLANKLNSGGLELVIDECTQYIVFSKNCFRASYGERDQKIKAFYRLKSTDQKCCIELTETETSSHQQSAQEWLATAEAASSKEEYLILNIEYDPIFMVWWGKIVD